MIFKNNWKFSMVACAIGGLLAYSPATVMAQDAYFWADGEKITLTEDRSTAMIKMNEASLSLSSALASMDVKEVHATKGRAIINMGQSPKLQSLSSRNSVESFSYGYKLEGGAPIYVTEEVLVQLKPEVKMEGLEELMKQYGAVYKRTDYNTVVLEVKDMNNALPLSNALATSGLAEFSQPNFYLKAERFNDPLFPFQFQMHNTGQTIQGFTGVPNADANVLEAWQITRGSSNIRVAVIDDGVAPHEDFDGPVAGFTPANNGNGTPIRNTDAHGQACAGIIVANHNNIGVRGVAPNTTLLAANIFAGGETNNDLANAINWAVANGADVISNSWGFPRACNLNIPVITNAIRNARNNGRGGRGSVVVFAAGNDGNTCVSYPGDLPEVIGVGAFSNLFRLSAYSNRGPALDIIAPSNDVGGNPRRQLGAGVYTTDRMGGPGYASGNYTTTFGGTSAACPVVSGVACLVLAVNPTLTVGQVENIIYSSARDVSTPGRDNISGWGVLNAVAAVQLAQGTARVATTATVDSRFNNENLREAVALGAYPNPVQSQLTVDFVYDQDKIYKAQVINYMGKVISEQAVSATNNKIEMESLAPGTYVLRLIAEGFGTQGTTRIVRAE